MVDDGKLNYDLIEIAGMDADDLRNAIRLIRMECRDRGLLDEATRENNKFMGYLDTVVDSDIGISRKDLSLLEYEQGYVEFLRGNYDQSVDLFESSTNNSLLDEDHVGEQIGKFRVVHTKVFAGQTSESAAISVMTDTLEEISNLRVSAEKAGEGVGRCDN